MGAYDFIVMCDIVIPRQTMERNYYRVSINQCLLINPKENNNYIKCFFLCLIEMFNRKYELIIWQKNPVFF